MNISIPNAASLSWSAREGLAACDMTQMWRVETGALRIDSTQSGQAIRFMRLALPGDVIDVEKRAGTGQLARA